MTLVYTDGETQYTEKVTRLYLKIKKTGCEKSQRKNTSNLREGDNRGKERI